MIKRKNMFGIGTMVLSVFLLACVPEERNPAISVKGGERSFRFSPEVLTNQWCSLSKWCVNTRRSIANVEDEAFRRAQAERYAEEWMNADFTKIPSSHYVLAADNYFKGIDYVIDVLLDAKIRNDDLLRFVDKLLAKYKQICNDDCYLQDRIWKDDRIKQRSIRLLKADYENNVLFFKRKIIPILHPQVGE
jgi:hypothetical protein